MSPGRVNFRKGKIGNLREKKKHEHDRNKCKLLEDRLSQNKGMMLMTNEKKRTLAYLAKQNCLFVLWFTDMLNIHFSS